MRIFRLDVIAKTNDGWTLGFHHEEEALTYAEAYAATLAHVRAKGFTVIKARRDEPVPA